MKSIASLFMVLLFNVLVSFNVFASEPSLLDESYAVAPPDSVTSAILPDTMLELDRIMVTATHLSTPLQSSGRNVSVIGRQQIRNSSATSLDELLRTFTGVNINARQQFGIQADIGMRGSTYSQVLVMLDHVPLSDPLTGHFNANIPVPLSEIGQIELIRGPAAASFGANAVGGVIHIKTNSFLQRLALQPSGRKSEATMETLQDKSGANDSPDPGEDGSVSSAPSMQKTLASGHITQSVGEHGLTISDGSLMVRAGSWLMSAGGRWARSDGQTFANPAFEAGLSSSETFRTFFDHTNATVSAAFAPNRRFTATARAGFGQRDFNARYFYTISLYDQSREEIGNQWAITTMEYRTNDHQFRMDGGFRRVTDRFDFNSAIAPVNEHTTHQTYLNLSHEWAGNSLLPFRMVSGLQVLDQQIESTDRGDHRDASGGVYWIGSIGNDDAGVGAGAGADAGDGSNPGTGADASASTRKKEKGVGQNRDRNRGRGLGRQKETLQAQTDWRVTGSLRLQRDPNGELSLLPQLSGSLQKMGWTVRASAGRAVRNGDFTERYIGNNLQTVLPGRNLGNPLLEPESSVTFDAGVDWRPAMIPGARFSATYFYRVSDRLIDYVLTPAEEIPTARSGQIVAGESYFYTRNIAESRTRGVETELSARRQVTTRHNIGIRLGYTYLKTTNEENVVSRYIANHPDHQASLTLDYQWVERFTLRSETYIQMREKEVAEALNSEVRESYMVSNLKAGVKIGGRRWSGLRMFSRMYNIGNTQYQEILGAPMPRRWVSAGVELNF